MAASAGPGVPLVKVEQDPGLAGYDEPHIKPDPESVDASPLPLSEDDIYEDAGDLDFAQYDPMVYLMRVPRYLWENWSKLGDDEPVKLGTVRVQELGKSPDGQEKTKVHMARQSRLRLTESSNSLPFSFRRRSSRIVASRRSTTSK